MDVDAGRVVKGTRFIDIRDAGDPVELAAHYDATGADELIFLDITATSDKRATVVELARRAADEVFVPFTIGGGVREVADAQAVLDAGADKVAVNSAAVARPELVSRDGRRVRRPVRGAGDRRQAPRRRASRSTWPAAGRRRAATRWHGRARASSAGRGRSCSPRWTATAPRTATTRELVRAIASAVDVPVIASGGAGEPGAPGRRVVGGRGRRAVRLDLPLRGVHDPRGARGAAGRGRADAAVRDELRH